MDEFDTGTSQTSVWVDGSAAGDQEESLYTSAPLAYQPLTWREDLRPEDGAPPEDGIWGAGAALDDEAARRAANDIFKARDGLGTDHKAINAALNECRT